jgi:hypothetical protein
MTLVRESEYHATRQLTPGPTHTDDPLKAGHPAQATGSPAYRQAEDLAPASPGRAVAVDVAGRVAASIERQR